MLPGIIIIAVLILIYLLFWWRYSRRAAALLSEVQASGAPTSYSKYIESMPAQSFEPNILDKALQQIAIADKVNAQEKLADQKIIREFLDHSIREQKPELWEQAQAVVAKYSEILHELKTAASRQELKAPVGGPGNMEARNAYFVGLRAVISMVNAQALLDAKQGNSDSAIESILLGFNIEELFYIEPTIIAQLIRTASTRVMLTRLTDCLELIDLNDAQAKRLDEALAKINLRGSFTKTYEVERAYALDLIHTATVLNFSPLYHANVVNYLEYMAGVIKGVDLNFNEARERGLLNPVPHVPVYGSLVQRAASINSGASAVMYITESAITCARLFLAVQLYKVKIGSYPESLEETAAQIGWTLPSDPLTDAPFAYQLTSDGFTLQSNCSADFQCPKIEAKCISPDSYHFTFDPGGTLQQISPVVQQALDQIVQQEEQPKDEQ